MQTILITGGTGFVASHLIEALLERSDYAIHLTTHSQKTPSLPQTLTESLHIHTIDLTNQEATTALIKAIQPDQIYHLASLSRVGESFDKTQEIITQNIRLQCNLLEAVRIASPKSRVLHVSTGLVYQAANGKLNEQAPLGPENPYALSKLTQDLLCEIYVKNNKLDIVRARPFNHIGERQGLGFVVADLAAAIVAIEKKQSNALRVGNLASIRDFSDVKDIVQAYITLMERGETGEVYNIGSGKGVSIQYILDTLIAQAKTPISVVVDPQKIRPVDLPSLVCDNEKIKQLGWQPTHQLESTLERILNYWRGHL